MFKNHFSSIILLLFLVILSLSNCSPPITIKSNVDKPSDKTYKSLLVVVSTPKIDKYPFLGRSSINNVVYWRKFSEAIVEYLQKDVSEREKGSSIQFNSYIITGLELDPEKELEKNIKESSCDAVLFLKEKNVIIKPQVFRDTFHHSDLECTLRDPEIDKIIWRAKIENIRPNKCKHIAKMIISRLLEDGVL